MRRKTQKPKVEKVLRLKKCGVCGKTFCRLNYNDYAYKDGKKYFCSYNCMQFARRIGRDGVGV